MLRSPPAFAIDAKTLLKFLKNKTRMANSDPNSFTDSSHTPTAKIHRWPPRNQTAMREAPVLQKYIRSHSDLRIRIILTSRCSRPRK